MTVLFRRKTPLPVSAPDATPWMAQEVVGGRVVMRERRVYRSSDGSLYTMSSSPRYLRERLESPLPDDPPGV